VSTISKSFYVDDVLTNMTTVKLSDPTGTYGVKRTDTGAVVVADGTAMTSAGNGLYRHEFTDPALDLTYEYYLEVVYAGETYWVKGSFLGPQSSAVDGLLTGAQIRAEVAANLGRTDLTARILLWVKLAVEKVYSLLKFQGLESTADFTTAANTGDYALSSITDDSGYTIHQLKKVQLHKADEAAPILLVSKDELDAKFPYPYSTTGDPTHAAIWAGRVYLRPVPNATLTIDLDTYVVPPTIEDAGYFVVKGLDQALIALATSIGYESLGEEGRASHWAREFEADFAAGVERDRRNTLRAFQPFELSQSGNDPHTWTDGFTARAG
jgi:hypothetical protein